MFFLCQKWTYKHRGGLNRLGGLHLWDVGSWARDLGSGSNMDIVKGLLRLFCHTEVVIMCFPRDMASRSATHFIFYTCRTRVLVN